MALELRFTIPGQAERDVPLDLTPVRIGALLSNQVVLRAPGVEPIHALIEDNEQGHLVITDLGSQTGIKVNGVTIEVESPLNIGDSIQIGTVTLKVAQSASKIPALPLANGQVIPQVDSLAVNAGSSANQKRAQGTEVRNIEITPKHQFENTVDSAAVAIQATEHQAPKRDERKKEVLFSPRKARPGGDVLECVAYWGDTVLEVELFHPSYKGFEQVTIGDPTKAHLIAAGKSHFEKMTFARVSGDGFKIYTRNGMHGRLRRSGKVEKINDQGEHSLGRRDIAHIRYGAVSYFLMFVKPPVIDFPRSGPRDPFFIGLVSLVMLLYMILVPVAWMHKPAELKAEKDDIYQFVDIPTKDKKPEPPKKEPEKKKPEIKVAEKKVPPKVPPKPVVKDPPKPAKPIEQEKPKQPKPVEKPVEQKKPTEVLTEAKEQPKPQETPPGPKDTSKTETKQSGPVDKPQNKAPGELNKLSANLSGMPSTGAKTPDNKLAGPTLPNTAMGKSGGAIGSGMNQQGGAIKGNSTASTQGVEGVNNNKPSGVNLSKLGIGSGKISNLTGPGAISTPFKDSAGGAGGGSGSASKTYGLGGPGNGSSLGIAGAGSKVGNFGSGSGGLLSGAGGSGGAGGLGLGGGGGGGGGGAGGGGHGRANITIPPGDPVVSGGLTAQEIMAVIRANLNQVRHCYETLLQRSPNAAGKMTVNFTIGTNGRVSTVSVGTSTISDAVMRGCVTGAVRRWPFPQPRGGQPVSVNYPFVFNPL
jgi:TonB family protein